MSDEYTIHVGPRSMEWLPIADSRTSRRAANTRCAELMLEMKEMFDAPIKGEVRCRVELMDGYGITANGNAARRTYSKDGGPMPPAPPFHYDDTAPRPVLTWDDATHMLVAE